MRIAIALLFLGLAIGVTRPAAACPPPPPGETCSKYDKHRVDVDVVKVVTPPPVTIYFRGSLGKLPKTARRVMRHLISAQWHPEDQTNGDAPIQLFDGSNIPDVVDLDPDVRNVIIHGLKKVHGRFEVTMDDGVFAVRRCREAGQITTCLVRM